MPFSKLAHESALAKVAAADATEVPDAIRLGFMAACDVLNLSEAQSLHLGKMAQVALEVSGAKDGLAKIAAEIAPGAQTPAPGGADVDKQSVNPSNDPGMVMYKLQLEAASKNIPVEQLAKQQGINLAALQKAIQAGDTGKNEAGKSMDAKTKADAAKAAVPGAPAAPLSPYGAVSTPTANDPGGLFGEPPAMPAAPSAASDAANNAKLNDRGNGTATQVNNTNPALIQGASKAMQTPPKPVTPPAPKPAVPPAPPKPATPPAPVSAAPKAPAAPKQA